MAKKTRFDYKRALIIGAIYAILITIYNLILIKETFLGWDNIIFRILIAITVVFIGFLIAEQLAEKSKAIFRIYDITAIIIATVLTTIIYRITGNLINIFGYTMWITYVIEKFVVIFLAIAIYEYIKGLTQKRK